eukprot:569475-Pelagomonas_calceolata.AAC.5
MAKEYCLPVDKEFTGGQASRSFQVLHPQAMQPAIRSGKMGVRVKNSYNREIKRLSAQGAADHGQAGRQTVLNLAFTVLAMPCPQSRAA